ncbi:alpha/beta fold hydrolase [Paenisporosarcina cavernae]|uniref:Alpha/beta fold hydrolase n=1 Tax=Paenisporosarcina cavernae TaxID=2320858 RepID=A0A385YR85_9BACL|nr:prolyl oligopeptidase family serine peptidase [Paenisporosarcina cavernae]AYC29001.1 alpha/beta fold hydrolase [Paenisporosarcina cavernae]
MLVESLHWNGIPILHIVNSEEDYPKRPTVLFLHGFTSAKEHNLHYAYNLANKGFRVLLPDAHLHGERSENLDEVQLSLRFWEIVLTTLEEIPAIRTKLMEQGLADESTPFGLAGTSMGGIETLGALTAYPWIDAAAVMMGSPGYVELAKAQIAQFENRGFKLPITDVERKGIFTALERFDLTKQSEKLANRPVFFWHGEQDTVVPFAPTHHFFQAMKERYPEESKWQFMRDRMAGHAVSRAGMLASVDFLAEHLSE